MRFLFLAVLFISVAFAPKLCAQTVTYDTTYQVTEHNGVYDTVIYVRKHVEIVQHHYIVDSLPPRSWAYDVFIGGVLFSTASYFPEAAEKKKSENKGLTIGGSVYYNLSPKFHVRAGLNLQYLKREQSYHLRYQQSETKVVTQTDTLDEYYVVDNFTDTAYYYITETRDLEQVSEWDYTVAHRTKHEFWHLHLPVQIGYAFKAKKWSFSCLSGIGVQLLVHQEQKMVVPVVSGETRVYRTTKSEISANFLASLQVHYAISEKTHVQVEPAFQQVLNREVYSYYPTRMFMVNVGVKHFF